MWNGFSHFHQRSTSLISSGNGSWKCRFLIPTLGKNFLKGETMFSNLDNFGTLRIKWVLVSLPVVLKSISYVYVDIYVHSQMSRDYWLRDGSCNSFRTSKACEFVPQMSTHQMSILNTTACLGFLQDTHCLWTPQDMSLFVRLGVAKTSERMARGYCQNNQSGSFCIHWKMFYINIFFISCIEKNEKYM